MDRQGGAAGGVASCVLWMWWTLKEAYGLNVHQRTERRACPLGNFSSLNTFTIVEGSGGEKWERLERQRNR